MATIEFDQTVKTVSFRDYLDTHEKVELGLVNILRRVIRIKALDRLEQKIEDEANLRRSQIQLGYLHQSEL